MIHIYLEDIDSHIHIWKVSIHTYLEDIDSHIFVRYVKQDGEKFLHEFVREEWKEGEF